MKKWEKFIIHNTIHKTKNSQVKSIRVYPSTVEDVKCRSSLFKEIIHENRVINAP